MKSISVSEARERVLAWFPEREFIVRSEGQVRFVKITSRLQIAAASTVAAALAAIGIALGAAIVLHVQGQTERSAYSLRAAQVVAAEGDVASYRHDLHAVTADLERRQAFLEQMSKMLPADVQPGEGAPEAAADPAAKTLRKVSAALPETGALARIEARQLSLVERLTRFAEQRSARAEVAIRQLGLNPAAIGRSMKDNTAMGGPLIRLATESNGTVEPRFRRLGVSLARMDALERGLASIPQVMPADISMISSGFGYRSDPFTGVAAMHAGLDFRGPIGAPIFAAAPGTVSFVGQRSGYGNVVEITHGNGLLTRYAHMSAFRTSVGRQVAAGGIIGLIGSSGRSTGSHLHFEVRINDRAVNPRPFLETAPHVLEEARARSELS